MLTIECLDRPVMLFLKDGSSFKASSFKGEQHFTTEFFLVTQKSTIKNCLTLMLLKPCSLCCDATVLMPVDEFITIDISCFCGYQSIPDICIKECHHPSIRIKDSICGPFTILPGSDETIIWQSNVIDKQYVSIKICIDKGKDIPLKLRIYDNDLGIYETHQLIDQRIYNFSVINCSAIKILRTNVASKVQGVFEITLQNMLEN